MALIRDLSTDEKMASTVGVLFLPSTKISAKLKSIVSGSSQELLDDKGNTAIKTASPS
ncbi:hypothetical protein QKW52_28265 [Bacillus sonorensis]|nr:hypothetical protein [Bacillus sonorensis]